MGRNQAVPESQVLRCELACGGGTLEISLQMAMGLLSLSCSVLSNGPLGMLGPESPGQRKEAVRCSTQRLQRTAGQPGIRRGDQPPQSWTGRWEASLLPGNGVEAASSFWRSTGQAEASA